MLKDLDTKTLVRELEDMHDKLSAYDTGLKKLILKIASIEKVLKKEVKKESKQNVKVKSSRNIFILGKRAYNHIKGN